MKENIPPKASAQGKGVTATDPFFFVCSSFACILLYLTSDLSNFLKRLSVKRLGLSSQHETLEELTYEFFCFLFVLFFLEEEGNSMGLPLGIEYERKKQKLQQELRKDYRHYMAQVTF